MSSAALVLAACCLMLAAMVFMAAPGRAAQKLVTLDVPSALVDPATQDFQDEPLTPSMGTHPGTLKANVLLPDGYTKSKRYPLLLLFHGAGERFDSWADPDLGDIRETAAGLNAVIVMPEGAHGFYANWFNGGQRGDPSWENYISDVLLPTVETKFSIRPERRFHAVVGFSMGGYGTWLTAARNAGYFGTVVPLSSFASVRDPLAVTLFATASGGTPYETIYGPADGFYAESHDPLEFGPNLRYSRLDVYTGDGKPDTALRPQNATPADGLSLLLEGALKKQNDEAVAAMRAAGNTNVEYTVHKGSHHFEFWRPDLKAAITKGLFRPVQQQPADWDYIVPSGSGKAWDVAYRFTEPNTRAVRFSKRGRDLAATGDGRVEISDGNGCVTSTSIPFDRPLSSTPCRKLRARVSGRLKAGKSRAIRVRVTGKGDFGVRGLIDAAEVRAGRASALTAHNGIAVLKVRPKKAGTLKLTVSKTGHRPFVKKLKVR